MSSRPTLPPTAERPPLRLLQRPPCLQPVAQPPRISWLTRWFARLLPQR